MVVVHIALQGLDNYPHFSIRTPQFALFQFASPNFAIRYLLMPLPEAINFEFVCLPDSVSTALNKIYFWWGGL